MSDLIKSITTDITTISINDVLEEAFETAVEITPGNNDLILSYNPVSQTLGKSTFPTDATAIANEAKTEAASAYIIASSFDTAIQKNSEDVQDAITKAANAKIGTDQLALAVAPSLKVIDASPVKVVSFRQDKLIPQFTITQDLALTIDMTDAKIGCTTSFSCLQQNGAKILLNGVKQSGYPLADQDNAVNDYLVFLPAIDRPRFIRFVDSEYYPKDAASIGKITIEAVVLSDTEIKFNYTLVASATKYVLSLFTSADFSGAPAFVFEDTTDLLMKVFSGLTPNTTYYYKIVASAGNVNGEAVTGSAITEKGYSQSWFIDFSQPLINDGSNGYTAENDPVFIYKPSGNLVQVANGKLGVNGNGNGISDMYLYKKPTQHFLVGEKYRITFLELSPYVVLTVGYSSTAATSVIGETAVFDFIINGEYENAIVHAESSNGTYYVGAIKIEKQDQ